MDKAIEKRIEKLGVHIEDANRSADVAGEYAEEAGYKAGKR